MRRHLETTFLANVRTRHFGCDYTRSSIPRLQTGLTPDQLGKIRGIGCWTITWPPRPAAPRTGWSASRIRGLLKTYRPIQDVQTNSGGRHTWDRCGTQAAQQSAGDSENERERQQAWQRSRNHHPGESKGLTGSTRLKGPETGGFPKTVQVQLEKSKTGLQPAQTRSSTG